VSLIEMSEIPSGARRRWVTRVPVSVGCSVNDQIVLLSLTRNANSRWGSKATTLVRVGHIRGPRRLMLNACVPSWTGPPRTIVRTTCGLHLDIRGRSVTKDHTFAGGAATSMLSSSKGSYSVMVLRPWGKP
jgi:hypothetical protein